MPYGKRKKKLKPFSFFFYSFPIPRIDFLHRRRKGPCWGCRSSPCSRWAWSLPPQACTEPGRWSWTSGSERIPLRWTGGTRRSGRNGWKDPVWSVVVVGIHRVNFWIIHWFIHSGSQYEGKTADVILMLSLFYSLVFLLVTLTKERAPANPLNRIMAYFPDSIVRTTTCFFSLSLIDQQNIETSQIYSCRHRVLSAIVTSAERLVTCVFGLSTVFRPFQMSRGS